MTKEKNVLLWDIYEVNSPNTLHGIGFRGKVRKFGLVNDINVLVENVNEKDGSNKVRFAVLSGEDGEKISNFIENSFEEVEIEKVMEKVKNPVLSKLKINYRDRLHLYDMGISE